MAQISPQWQPYSEPLRTTLTRTILIALVAGAIIASFWGGLSRWSLATLLAFWPSLGGHLIELWFLNWLRPRLPQALAPQIVARLAVWFIGGTAFSLCIALTLRTLTGFWLRYLPAWWLPGVAFIAIELAIHLGAQLRGRPSFYNGRG